MEKEVISIDPKLNKLHKEDFLKFCYRLKRSLNRRVDTARLDFLIQAKAEATQLYKGRGFHSIADLVFVKNLLLDLLLQDWNLMINRKQVTLELEVLDEKDKNLNEEKAKIRRRHLLARDVQLKVPSVVDFVRGIERKRLNPKGWHSIFSLMRDGSDLAKRLLPIAQLATDEEKLLELTKTIKPYIQIVEPDLKCRETGLPLKDIWRYFRHTWATEYKSLPGRSISILIRDAAVPNHPVIGIAALGSSVAQQSVRDEWIGWEGNVFIERIKNEPSAKYARWIRSTLKMLLGEIYLKDFFSSGIISTADIKNPTEKKIRQLKEYSIYCRAKHVNNPSSSRFTMVNDSMTWEERAKTNLFKSKRSLILAELLSIKMVLNKYRFKGNGKRELARCLEYGDFRDSVQKLARKAKSIHVGINMMDIIICGSIPPYNHLLGGKLVCMMLMSPEITRYYNEKYNDTESLIASSMKGKAVVRKPQLVMMGTTSLYGVGSSQYNRVKVPASQLGGSAEHKIEYRELGVSEGFGSFHFSGNTIELADIVAGRENGRTKVNSIFGEGANPLIRKLRDAMYHLNLECNPILNHRNKRVVYGVSLAENFGDVLLGLAKRPKYLIPQAKPKLSTERIGQYWIKRWLLNRIKNEEIISHVASHSLAYPITHGARVPLAPQDQSPTVFD